jgi:hyperosmotically inducible protein
MKTLPTPTAVLVAALAMAGCVRHDDVPVPRTTEATLAQAQVSGADSAASKVAREASEATRRAAVEAALASKNAADQATNKVADAIITTSVHAELAKDPALSALRIDVDTDNGRVALRGTAPDQSAKERATQVASAVQGVVSVDNQLEIGQS